MRGLLDPAHVAGFRAVVDAAVERRKRIDPRAFSDLTTYEQSFTQCQYRHCQPKFTPA